MLHSVQRKIYHAFIVESEMQHTLCCILLHLVNYCVVSYVIVCCRLELQVKCVVSCVVVCHSNVGLCGILYHELFVNYSALAEWPL